MGTLVEREIVPNEVKYDTNNKRRHVVMLGGI